MPPLKYLQSKRSLFYLHDILCLTTKFYKVCSRLTLSRDWDCWYLFSVKGKLKRQIPPLKIDKSYNPCLPRKKAEGEGEGVTGVRAAGIFVMGRKNDRIVNGRVERCLVKVECLSFVRQEFEQHVCCLKTDRTLIFPCHATSIAEIGSHMLTV